MNLTASLLLVIICGTVAVRARRFVRHVALTVSSLLLLRMVLFGNPWAWAWYAQKLGPDDIGWRQADSVRARSVAVRPGMDRPRSLAVGSSQTGYLYQTYGAAHPELEVFVVSGMSPIDLVLYRDDILARRPEEILLYVGERDLAQLPDPASLAMAPSLGRRLPSLLGDLRRAPRTAGYEQAIVDIALGELLPEYKYRFVLRGVIDKVFSRTADRLGSPVPREARGGTIEQRMRWLLESFDVEFIPFNIRFLDQFLADMEQAGIRVVVVEGALNPLVADSGTQRRHAAVRTALVECVARFEHATLLPRDEVLEFGASDFKDLTHVTPDAGDRFAVALMKRLGRAPRAAVPMPRTDRSAVDRTATLQQRSREHRDARVVFIGDSITESWETVGSAAWIAHLAPFGALNLGVAGDRTEHILWRLERMPDHVLTPKVAVVLAGANNSREPDQTPAEIACGIAAIVDRAREQWPDAEVLVLGLLPRGTPDDAIGAKNRRINEQLRAWSKAGRFEYLDPDPALADDSGALRSELRVDRVHLSGAGYERLAAALSGPLWRLLD